MFFANWFRAERLRCRRRGWQCPDRWRAAASYRGGLRRAQLVEWAPDGATAGGEYVGVDHRRFHAGVTQEFLHGANIVAGREQVGGKRMAQGMGGRPLADARALDRVAKCPRDRTFMQVPADPLVSPRVDALARIGCDCVQWPTIKEARPPGGWGGAIEGIGGLGGQELASKSTRRRAGVSGTQRKTGPLGLRDRDCLLKDGQRLQ